MSPEKQKRRKLKIAGAVALLAAALGVFFGARHWRLAARPVLFEEISSWDLTAATPSGLAWEKANGEKADKTEGEKFWLWLCDWKSGEIFKFSGDDPTRVVKRLASPSPFFHPNSLAVDGDGRFLFTLDSVSHKISKRFLAEPSVVIGEIPTPSASCLNLAMLSLSGGASGSSGDTKLNSAELSIVSPRLVVLDTVGKNVYAYNPVKFKEKPVLLFALPAEMSPLSIAGAKDSLWVLDAASGLIHRFEPDSKGRWNKRRSVKVVLPDGAKTVANASAILFKDPQTLYLTLEGDPSKLILAKSKEVKP